MVTRLILMIVATNTLAHSHAYARDSDEPKVLLSWHGQSYFRIETKLGKTILIDPHALDFFDPPFFSADIILFSYPLAADTAAKAGLPEFERVRNANAARVFLGVKTHSKHRSDWNKINEKVGQVKIRSFPLFQDQTQGQDRGKTAAFLLETDGLRLLHLGRCGHELTAAQIQEFGKIDVVMIPVGGVETLNGAAAKRMIGLLKPRIASVPMLFGLPGFDDWLPAEEFLDNAKNIVHITPRNVWEIPADPPTEGPIVVVFPGTVPRERKPD